MKPSKKRQRQLRKKLQAPDKMKDRIGRCYELSAHAILLHEHEGWQLVHGTITAPDDLKNEVRHKSLHHAWCEYTYRDTLLMDRERPAHVELDMVHDAVLGRDVPKEYYYDRFSAKPDRIYSTEAAIKLLLQQNNYGPWKVDQG